MGTSSKVLSGRVGRLLLVSVFGLVGLFVTAAPQGVAGASERAGKPLSPPAKYSLKAVRFTAVDESGWDGSWLVPISDEPYFTFSSVGKAGTASTTMSHVFDDVDSGESRNFSATEGCLWGGTGCAGAVAPYGIGFSVGGWENDLCCPQRTLTRTILAFADVGPLRSPADAASWVQRATPILSDIHTPSEGTVIHDDEFGHWTMGFTPQALKAFAPRVGSNLTFPIRITDRDADYLIWMHLRRTA